ncbi:Hypothetical_protein [Hexamita inflata]|uniref:Hypothetical_protein n=1 Tax=Hexamita inflata TaxID=28002 RepID=A0AA86N5J8_9EUKA|nr:Hypothetical protein HINF_LOCUS883 [Hexamita inflata]CAI9914453.1 Hypothetical protein HINF_LOCUS2098 [Hexamita inflata]CAI9930471.1 Hypothetical protein HINF_LOCUS18116 [Hexamita inflata]
MKLTLRFLTYSIPFDTMPEVLVEAALNHLEAELRIPAACFQLKYYDDILNPEKTFDYYVITEDTGILVKLHSQFIEKSAALADVNILFSVIYNQPDIVTKVEEYNDAPKKVKLMEDTLVLIMSLLEMLRMLNKSLQEQGGWTKVTREKVIQSKVSSASLQKVLVRLAIAFFVLKNYKGEDEIEQEFVYQLQLFVKCITLDVKSTVDVLQQNGL